MTMTKEMQKDANRMTALCDLLDYGEVEISFLGEVDKLGVPLARREIETGFELRAAIDAALKSKK
jgi:hypothetical protein